MNKRYQLPEHRKAHVPAFFYEEAQLWDPCTDGLLLPIRLKCGLAVRRIDVVFPRLAGRKILFFSDLHIRSHAVSCLFPFLPMAGGLTWIEKAFCELSDAIGRPDMIVFGGDLAAEAAWIAPTADWLAKAFPADIPKLAVAGNWEMRRIWLGRQAWRDIFARAGFTLLSPQAAFSSESLEIRVLADYKEEQQSAPCQYCNTEAFHCVVMHNPDAAVALRDSGFFSKTGFMFAGHTHGGQLRLPGYGALLTSSCLGKKFEYGLYRHRQYGTKLFVSAGIGTTWIPVRVLCPPEVVVLSFV